MMTANTGQTQAVFRSKLNSDCTVKRASYISTRNEKRFVENQVLYEIKKFCL